jgi:hypothetical protein
MKMSGEFWHHLDHTKAGVSLVDGWKWEGGGEMHTGVRMRVCMCKCVHLCVRFLSYMTLAFDKKQHGL